MLPEIKKIVLAIAVTGFVGAIFGGIMGGLAADFLSLEFFLWVGISTVVGAGLGIALAYGLLPER
jgi:cation transporter-like permease